MLTYKCPNNPEHDRFVTVAHELHDWVVDSHGDFIEDLGCIETSFPPHGDNIWACRQCGAEAVQDKEAQTK